VTGTGRGSQERRVRSSVENVDNGNDVGEFLVSRRAKIPSDPGLTLTIYSAEPGAAAADVLASRAATSQEADQSAANAAELWQGSNSKG
jgi:hypothetical protein